MSAKILTELEVDPHDHGRLIEVWNKVDLAAPEERARLRGAASRRPADERASVVSAVTGEGLDDLLLAIEARLARGRPVLNVALDAGDGEGQAWLYAHTEVLSRTNDDFGRAFFEIRVAPDQQKRILRRFPGAVAGQGGAPQARAYRPA